jgi:hypothetical protein
MTQSAVTKDGYEILSPFSFSVFRLTIHAEEPLYLPALFCSENGSVQEKRPFSVWDAMN